MAPQPINNQPSDQLELPRFTHAPNEPTKGMHTSVAHGFGADPRAMLVYAHDQDGRLIKKSLVPALTRHHINVICDDDLKTQNVTSMPEWMASCIEQYPVICAISGGFMENATDETDTITGKGRIFERRMIYRKFYAHKANRGCPIIPVALAEFNEDTAGPVFASLSIVRFDPISKRGVDEIVSRLRNL